MRTHLIALAGLLALASSLKAQTVTITAWSFDNDTVASPVLNPGTSTGTGTASSIGMTGAFTSGGGVNTPDIVLGKSTDTGLNTVADLTNTWRIRATGGTGTNNGWSSGAPIGSQGAEFDVNTTGYKNIQISFDWYSTTQGEANLQLQYTTDGSTWINQAITLSGSDTGLQVLTNSTSSNTVTGSYLSDNLLNNASAGQDWFTNLTATIPAAAANNPNFGIRLVNASTGADDVNTQGTALNNTSGNWRFDNVVIQGQLLAVPEPSSGATLLGGIGMLLGFGRMRRKLRIA